MEAVLNTCIASVQDIFGAVEDLDDEVATSDDLAIIEEQLFSLVILFYLIRQFSGSDYSHQRNHVPVRKT